MTPKVLNKKTSKLDGYYIGRPSKYGNQFIIGKDGTREEVIEKYKIWLQTQPELIEDIKKELKGHNLICWCSPLPCHGDILLQIANEPIEPSILRY